MRADTFPGRATERARRLTLSSFKRLIAAVHSPHASRVLAAPVQSGGFGDLSGHETCLVVTYRRDGRPVAQPVWPVFADGRMYVWTEHRAYKAVRLRNNPDALVAPCTFRGRPLGPPVAARGRVLDNPSEIAHAERVVRAGWGWRQRAFERLARPVTPVLYLEFVRAAPD